MPKEPKQSLEGFTNTGQTYAKWEIWKSETKLAIVDVLKDWSREIYILDDLPNLNAKDNQSI
jgi:hypothetical protein